MDLTTKPRLDPSLTHRGSNGSRNNTQIFEDNRKSQVAHTLTACCRCRQRKTRCDPALPRCTPCERNKAQCEYYDAARGRKMPRAYVVHLQERVRQLEAQLEDLNNGSNLPVDFELLVRGAGLVKIRENDESRFLGPSSGIAMTRLVMELAKELCNVKRIREVVPESMAQGIKDRFAEEQSKPTSKAYPLISFVAAPSLPTPELTNKLVGDFIAKDQLHYPVLHEPSLLQVVKEVYNGSTDDYKNFTLRMVLALSMHKLDTPYPGLADSYYLAALPYLENAIRPLNTGTLQCFALIAEYSMTTPTRTAAYWVVGLATKLMQVLRMTDESTIDKDVSGNPLNTVEADLRRRLFWIISTLELGLAHSLGRPSALAFTHDHPDVKPFLDVDDKYITRQGVLPGSPVSLKKQRAVHFMKMRFLQLDIRRTLYLKKRPEPVNDADPWFTSMESKIHEWMQTYPRNEDGGNEGEKWFKIRYHTMIVFLFRPSPQVPHPSIRAARMCFKAVRLNIYLQKEQIDSKSADTTWIFTQQLFMAINTLLWAMSYAEIRDEHPKSEVEKDLHLALEAIWWASKRWPGVESALELYTLLCQACMKAYDGQVGVSYGVGSPPQPQDSGSPGNLDGSLPLSTSSNPIMHGAPAQLPPSEAHLPILSDVPYLSRSQDPEVRPSYNGIPTIPTLPGGPLSSDSTIDYDLADPTFNLNSLQNPLPPPIDYNYGQSSPEHILSLLTQNRGAFLGPLGDQFHDLQYMSIEPMEGLNSEQQSELMHALESNGLDGTPERGSYNLVVNRDLL